MSEPPPVPFLAQFFESRRGDANAALGTETFTKTDESGDADAAAEPGGRRVAAPSTLGTAIATHVRQEEADADTPRRRATVVLGTETITEVRREGSDVDEPRRASYAVTGTQTATAVQEAPDEDHPARRVTLLGTETLTRAHEESDADASRGAGGGSLWTARVL